MEVESEDDLLADVSNKKHTGCNYVKIDVNLFRSHNFQSDDIDEEVHANLVKTKKVIIRAFSYSAREPKNEYYPSTACYRLSG